MERKTEMEIFSVYDPVFKPYGKVLAGYDFSELHTAMMAIPLPESGTAYQAGIASLENCAVFSELRDRAYGGMPIQLGMCWGHNNQLNCLEYHRDSEVNIGTHDFILLLALESQIENGQLDTKKVMAFRVPADTAVEVYATTLHYAPCHTDAGEGFRTAVVLPLGTNTDKPEIRTGNFEDRLLWARNKWLLAHPDSSEAGQGAYVGLAGENISLAADR